MAPTFVILAITLGLLISGRLRSDLVALLALLALYVTGILSIEQSLAGFGNATVIMIASLFVVGEGLSRTGITSWLGERVLQLAGESPLRLVVVLMVGTALLSAFISNTGTVATLLPAVVAASWRIGSVPSQFLIPLAFAANTGGMLTLTGTPPNIVVAEALASAGYDPFGYFEYALIGLPLLVCCVTFMALFARRLLPRHDSQERPEELLEIVGELSETFDLPQNLYRLRVRYRSSLVGKTLDEAGLGRDYGISVLSVMSGEEAAPREPRLHLPGGRRLRQGLQELQGEGDQLPGPRTDISANDTLLIKSSEQAAKQVMIEFNLAMSEVEGDAESLADALLSPEIGVAEVLLAPRSVYIGRTVTQGDFGRKFDVQVLGIRRGNRVLATKDTRLALGDALLVRGKWADIERIRNEGRNFVVVGSPDDMSRQVVQLSPQTLIAVLALVGMVGLMVSGRAPTVMAALLAAVIMILGGCLTMAQAYRAISWQSVVLIAAMIPISTALEVTGGAEFLAEALVNTLGTSGPLLLMTGVFLLTAGLSQVMNNTATAVLLAPIVLRAALELGSSPYPFLMVVAVSASTAFLTPFGTTTNLMVMSPGGYRVIDYFKVGLPLTLIFLAISLFLVPLIWPF